MKKRFKIPVTWEVYGTVIVEADSLDEAINYFDEHVDNIPLPDGWYIDDSFKREDEETIIFHNQ